MPKLALLVLLALSSAAAAAPEAKLGEWITVGGESYLPQVGLKLHLPFGPQPGIYRQIELNWRDGPLQVGPYPAEAFAKREEGDVGLSLDIETDGSVRGCRVAEPSGIPSLDAHACRHMLNHIRFHPGLDDRGEPFGGTVAARLGYELRARVSRPVEGYVEPPARSARPLQRIDLASIGIAPGTRRPKLVFGISADLMVEVDGSVSSCTLASGSFVDAIDRQACDKLRAMRFKPGEDAGGKPVAGRYTVSLEWKESY